MNLDSISRSLSSVRKSCPEVATVATMTVASLLGPEGVRKCASDSLAEPTQEDAWELLKALAAPRMAQGRSEAQAVADVFDQWRGLYAWHQSLRKADPTEASSVRQRIEDLPAHVPVAREIDRRVDAIVKHLRGTVDSHSYELERTRAYGDFILKDPEGQRLYKLHDAVYGRTLTELDHDAPAMSARVRKFMR